MAADDLRSALQNTMTLLIAHDAVPAAAPFDGWLHSAVEEFSTGISDID